MFFVAIRVANKVISLSPNLRLFETLSHHYQNAPGRDQSMFVNSRSLHWLHQYVDSSGCCCCCWWWWWWTINHTWLIQSASISATWHPEFDQTEVNVSSRSGPNWDSSSESVYTLWTKQTCHFVFDYNSGVSWAIVMLFCTNGYRSKYTTAVYSLDDVLTTSHCTSQHCNGRIVICRSRQPLVLADRSGSAFDRSSSYLQLSQKVV